MLDFAIDHKQTLSALDVMPLRTRTAPVLEPFDGVVRSIHELLNERIESHGYTARTTNAGYVIFETIDGDVAEIPQPEIEVHGQVRIRVALGPTLEPLMIDY